MAEKFDQAELVQAHVTGDRLSLLMKSGPETFTISLTIGAARELTHVMADALAVQERGLPDEKAGELLVPAELSPLRIETIPGALGLEEKFVLQAQSKGSTNIVMRLSTQSVQTWIDDAQMQIAKKAGKPN